MSRGTKIARGYKRGHDALRKIFLEGICLKVLSGDQSAYVTEATYTDGWWLDQKEYSDVVAGKKFKRLVVDDIEGCRLQKLRNATAMQVGDTIFKFAAKTSFIGSVPSYEFRLQPTGERV